ncbi:MAG: GTPase RsgA [Treponema sp.]|nr:GTPase RsgA [Treponema sp.]
MGKPSLVNALIPGIHSKVGLLNEKYDRGNHTTTISVALELPGSGDRTFIIRQFKCEVRIYIRQRPREASDNLKPCVDDY